MVQPCPAERNRATESNGKIWSMDGDPTATFLLAVPPALACHPSPLVKLSCKTCSSWAGLIL